MLRQSSSGDPRGESLLLESLDDALRELRLDVGQFGGAAGQGDEFAFDGYRLVRTALTGPVEVGGGEVGGMRAEQPPHQFGLGSCRGTGGRRRSAPRPVGGRCGRRCGRWPRRRTVRVPPQAAGRPGRRRSARSRRRRGRPPGATRVRWLQGPPPGRPAVPLHGGLAGARGQGVDRRSESLAAAVGARPGPAPRRRRVWFGATAAGSRSGRRELPPAVPPGGSPPPPPRPVPGVPPVRPMTGARTGSRVTRIAPPGFRAPAAGACRPAARP